MRRTVRAGRRVGKTITVVLQVVSLFFFFFLILNCKERYLFAGLCTDLVRGTKTGGEKKRGGERGDAVSFVLNAFVKLKHLNY